MRPASSGVATIVIDAVQPFGRVDAQWRVAQARTRVSGSPGEPPFGFSFVSRRQTAATHLDSSGLRCSTVVVTCYRYRRANTSSLRRKSRESLLASKQASKQRTRTASNRTKTVPGVTLDLSARPKPSRVVVARLRSVQVSEGPERAWRCAVSVLQ